jgi:mannose-6-phosphate isomerase
MSTDAPTFDPSGFSLAPRGRRVDKPWGYELLLSPEDAPYTAKLIHVRAGRRLSLQLHDAKVETQTLVAGRATLVLEGPDGRLHEVAMEPGVGYHIAVGQRHRLCAALDEDAVVCEASTPELGTTYRLADDYARPHETDALRQAERSG